MNQIIEVESGAIVLVIGKEFLERQGVMNLIHDIEAEIQDALDEDKNPS